MNNSDKEMSYLFVSIGALGISKLIRMHNDDASGMQDGSIKASPEVSIKNQKSITTISPKKEGNENI